MCRPKFLTPMGYHIFLTIVVRVHARSSAIKGLSDTGKISVTAHDIFIDTRFDRLLL